MKEDSTSAGKAEWKRTSTNTGSTERKRDSLPKMPKRASSVAENDVSSTESMTVTSASDLPLDDTKGATSVQEQEARKNDVMEKSPLPPVPSGLTQLENDVRTKLRSMGSTTSGTGDQSPTRATAGSSCMSTSKCNKQSQDNTAHCDVHSAGSRVGAIAVRGPVAAASHVQQELERLDRTVRRKLAFAQNSGSQSSLRTRLSNLEIKHDDGTADGAVPELHTPGEAAGVEENARVGPQMSEIGGSAEFESEDGTPSLPLSVASTTSSLSSGPPPAALAGLVEAELVDPEDQTIVVIAKEVIRWKSRNGILLLVALFAIVFVIPVSLLVAKLSIDDDSNNSSPSDRYYEENLRLKFEDDAHQLLESIGDRLELTMRAADTFMFEVVSQSRGTDSKWPLITIPDLAVQSAKLLSQTKSIYMAFYPFITADKRAEWENFTQYNDAWVEEGIRFQSRNPNFHGPTLDDYNVTHVIWKNEGLLHPDSPGPFMPSWMGSPIIPYYYPYNWNALAYEAFSKPLLATMASKSVVFGPVANHADPNDPIAVAQSELTNDWAIPYLTDGEDASEPFSDMYYPVIEMFDGVTLDVVNNNATEALGSVAFSFYWRDVMKSILSNDSKGLVIVFQNPCGGQLFTYQLGGKVPTFLGYGDNHNSRYDNLILSSKLSDLVNNNVNALLYTGLPINADFCPYTLTVYASDAYAADLHESVEGMVPESFSPLT